MSAISQLRYARARDSARPATETGDRVLAGLCAAAGILTVAILVGFAYQIFGGAGPAISRFGIAFIWHQDWAPNFGRFGALTPLYGTAVTSLLALLIALPMGVSIGVYLSMFARPAVRVVVGPLVEMLAAVPSVIVGFWGVFVLAPFLQKSVEPPLHDALGFTGLFGTPQTTGLSFFTAGLVLSFMILPIIASLSRDLFLTVPRDLRDGAEALGATHWEVIRGIVLPSTVSGVAAAAVLALGRALGEAIAVATVIGESNHISRSLFQPGTTIAAKIAQEFTSPENALHIPALYYLAAILLVIGVATTLTGQAIGRRYDVQLGASK